MKLRTKRRVSFESLESRRVLTTLADIDFDGDLDLVEAGAWHENADGFGNFEIHRLSPSADSAAVGDLDGDGDLDIASRLGWFENTDGQGDFETFHEFTFRTVLSSDTIKLQDVGGDGDLDIVLQVENRGTHFSNDGRGNFELGSDFTLSNLQDVADIDNDGDLDAVTIEYPNVWVHYNSGENEFSKTAWYTDTVPGQFDLPWEIPRTYSVSFVDVDADGWVDLTTTDGADGFSSFWVGVNDGTGKKLRTDMLASCFSCSYKLDDFDHDGNLDIIRSEGDVVNYFRQNLGGGQYRTIGSAYGDYVDGGDINGDGFIDIATGMKSEWYDGATKTKHRPGSTIQLPEPRGFTYVKNELPTRDGWTEGFAHLDNDGVVDTIYRDYNTVTVEFGEGEQQVVFEAPEYGVESVTATDMDNDGDLDIVVNAYRYAGWLENLNDRQFSPPHTIVSGLHFRYFELGDFDGDGLTDAVISTRGAGVFGGSTVSIYQNQGDRFLPTRLSHDGTTILDLDVVDVDNDDDLDVFLSTGEWLNDDHDRIYHQSWLENESGQFTEHSSIRTTEFRPSLQFGDLNNDGKTDLISSDFREAVWHDGVFGTKHIIDPNGDLFDVQVVDVDNDGDQDIVSSVENQVLWHENVNGGGSFSDKQLFGYSIFVRQIQAIDYDSDGDVDIAVFGEIAAYGDNGVNTLFEHRLTGDSNDDGIVNSTDLLTVFQYAQYEDNVYRNSTFESGDWNGDREFDSSDLVYLFASNTYENAAAKRQIAAAIATDRTFETFEGIHDDRRTSTLLAARPV